MKKLIAYMIMVSLLLTSIPLQAMGQSIGNETIDTAALVKGANSESNISLPKSPDEEKVTDDQKIEVNDIIEEKAPTEDPSKALNILYKISKISEATKGDQAVICDFFQINLETLLSSEKKGYSKYEAVNIAVLGKEFGFTLEEMEKVKNLYPQINKAVGELHSFKRLKVNSKLNVAQINQIKQLILKGHSMSQIEPAFIIGTALKTDIEKLIDKEQDKNKNKETNNEQKIYTLSGKHTKDEIASLKRLTERYPVDLEQLSSYSEKENISFNQIEETVNDFSALMETQSIEISGPINYTKYLNSPFGYRENDNETVNLARGGLQYDKNLLNIPGRNGMDLNLTIHYDSAQANLYNAYLQTIITNCGYDIYGNLISKETTNGDQTLLAENEYSATYGGSYLTKQKVKLKEAAIGNILEEKIIIQNTYDPNTGRIATLKDGRNNQTTYQYDKLGRTKKVIHPDSKEINITYDDLQNIVTVTDENNHQKRNIYDGLGRLKKSQEFREGIWSTLQENQYNTFSQIEWVKDALLNQTQFQYDIFGRITKIIDPNLQERQIKYHDAENKKIEIDPEGNTHKYWHDNQGQILYEAIQIDGTSSAYSYYDYDYQGNIIQITDANGQKTNYYYDDLGRMTQVTNALNQSTQYRYDNLNNIVEIIHPDGNSVKKSYNVLGKLKTQKDSLQNTEYFIYDGAGNLETYTDRKGDQTTYTYNNRNRLENKTANGKTISYTYDFAGNVKTVTDSNGTISYDYNENDSLKQETLPGSKNVKYEYDLNGNRTKITDPFNLNVNYQYDSLNRLDLLTVEGKTFDYEYYPDGMLKAVNYPILNNGLVLREEFTYDKGNRLKTVINKIGAEVISQYNYTYDWQGNILSETKDGQTTIQYEYDELNRLEMTRRPDGSYTSYWFDQRGNRIQSTGENIALREIEPGEFTFNQWGQLTQITKNGATYNYGYKPDGLRNKKESASGTIQYYLDNSGSVIAEAGASGQVTAQNIWGHKPLARKIGNSYYYYIYNGHGDVVQVVDVNGNIVNNYDYDEWGDVLNKTEQISNPIRYAGEYYDEESGLYYLRARYYDPSIGRFISEDSEEGQLTNPLSLNLYTYCWNNPVRYIDPDGHSPGDSLNKAALYVQVYVMTQFNKATNTLQRGIDKAKNFIGRKVTISNPATLEKGAGKGFDNLNALKKNLGPAGEGKAWHHVVEQSQIQKSGFSPQQIHNTNNVIAVDSATHAKISEHYSSIQDFTNGMRVRDWLAGQSYQTQYEYGLKTLRDFGVIK